MSRHYDAIVIGGGLGGLTGGALIARAGGRVLLIERNDSFGGAASTYRHGAMTVEASLHETTSPNTPADPKREIFEALDLEADIELVPVGDFQEVRASLLGAPFTLPHGFDALETGLGERFPTHRAAIRRFLRQIERTHRAFEILSGERGALWRPENAAELPIDLWSVYRDIGASLSEVLARYFGEDEAIKIALAANLNYYAHDPENFWWLGYAMAQGGYLRRGGNYIKGGSQVLSDRLAAIIREERGDTLTNSEAVAIELGADRTVAGVRYRHAGEDGDVFAAAPVILANAAPQVIEGMLPTDRREAFMAPYRQRPLSISLFAATFGLNRPPADLGVSSYSTVLVPDWISRLGDYRDAPGLFGAAPSDRLPPMVVVDYSHIDSGLDRGGVYPISVVSADRLANWGELSEEDYDARKAAWRDALLARLDQEWPGLADAVVERTAPQPSAGQ